MAKGKKSIVYPVTFMLIITVVFTLSLSLLNEFTIDRINYNRDLKIRRTLLYVFDVEVEAYSGESTDAIYKRYIEERIVDGKKLYVAKDGDEAYGYAFPIEGNGLWGSIHGFAAVSTDYSTLLGIDFISHNETPGLGGRISEPIFKDQFKQLSLSGSEGDYIIFRPAIGGNVDTITGATGTAKAVREILNEDIHAFISHMKGDR